MPALADHNSTSMTKLLLIGDSGTGKTGALTSLVEAGYRVRILDFDNGLSALLQQIKQRCPDKMGNVDFMTFRDTYKIEGQGIRAGSRAFPAAMKALDKWEDDTDPATWGPKTVLVLDSFTFFCDAAFNWAKGLNPTVKDPRQWYGTAQGAAEDVLAKLTSDDFATNVIVISHVAWLERSDGQTKGYPSSIGKALSPKIATYFDNVALMQTAGTGDKIRRELRTMPTALIDLKNPAAFKMQPNLGIETGLKEFFETVRG